VWSCDSVVYTAIGVRAPTPLGTLWLPHTQSPVTRSATLVRDGHQERGQERRCVVKPSEPPYLSRTPRGLPSASIGELVGAGRYPLPAALARIDTGDGNQHRIA
jgi:hypothetical protein